MSIESNFTQQDIEERFKRYWKTDNLIVIGRYTHHEGSPIAFFNELRNLSGDLLYFPAIEEIGLKLRLASAATIPSDKLTAGTYYRFELVINEEKFWKKNVLFVKPQPFGLPPKVLRERIEAEEQIKDIYKRKGATPDDGRDIAKALLNFQIELYTRPERFVFELLQNADDYPGDADPLKVSFKALKQNILFSHNGLPFRYEDVRSLCSIGDSTKSKDAAATGYKGIGFKSVFTYSSTVYITSGVYRFSFDKNHDEYTNFKRLYPGSKNDSFYIERAHEYTGPENVPWQLKPIWREWYRYPDEVQGQAEWFKQNVGICLEFGEENVRKFEGIIANLFREPRFMLFLKHIKQLSIATESGFAEQMKVQRNGPLVSIGSEEQSETYYVYKSATISIADKKKEFEKVDDIPKKILDFEGFTISFAAKTQGDNIAADDDAIIFTFLPTEDRNYGFPFLVNSDFVTSSNREQIQPGNLWNIFVFEHIGYQLFIWLQHIAQTEPQWYSSYLKLLPAKYTRSGAIYDSFNSGYGKGAEEVAFLPGNNGEMLTIGEAFLDTTGIFTIIAAEYAQSLPEFSGKKLIHHDVKDENGILRHLQAAHFNPSHLSELMQKQETVMKLIPDTDHFLNLISDISNLTEGESLLRELSDAKILPAGESAYAKITDFSLGVPVGYAELFAKLGIAVRLPEAIETKLREQPQLLDIFTDIFGIGTFNPLNALDELAKNQSKTRFADTANFESEAQRDRLLKQYWQFLFEYRASEVNEQKKVDGRFKEAILWDNRGELSALSDCKLEKQTVAQEEEPFLYRKFASEKQRLIDFRKLSFQAADNEIRAFFKQISDDVEVTNYSLYKKTFDFLADNNFKPMYDCTPDEIIKAGTELFLFSKKQDKLIQQKVIMFDFPVVSREGQIVPAKDVYLGNEFKPLFPKAEIYAEEIFGNCEGVYFISQKYLEVISENEKENFLRFLRQINIVGSLKVYDGQELKKNNRINVSLIDKGFSGRQSYNNGYVNFTSNYTFSLVGHFSHLEDKNDNLILFWKKIKHQWSSGLTGTISCNGYSRENPFIFLLCTYRLIPTSEGSKRSVDVYSPELSDYLPWVNQKVEIPPHVYKELSDKLSFKRKLDVDDIVSVLQHTRQLNKKLMETFFEKQLYARSFTEEETARIKAVILLPTYNGGLQAPDQLYCPTPLFMKTALADWVREGSEIADRLLPLNENDLKYRNFYKNLGVTFLDSSSVKYSFEQDEAAALTKEEIIQGITAYDDTIKIKGGNRPLHPFIEAYNFVPCTEIAVYAEGLEKHKKPVPFHVENTTICYTTPRNLLYALRQEGLDIPDSLLKNIIRDWEETPDEQHSDSLVASEALTYTADQVQILDRLFEDDRPQDYQKDDNLKAIIQCMQELERSGYEIEEAYSKLRDTKDYATVRPVVCRETGQSYSIKCRSAVSGIVFLSPSAIRDLNNDSVWLFVRYSDEDHQIYKSQEEFIAAIDDTVDFQLLKYRASSGSDGLMNIVDQSINTDELTLMVKMNRPSKYDELYFEKSRANNEDMNTSEIREDNDDGGY